MSYARGGEIGMGSTIINRSIGFINSGWCIIGRWHTAIVSPLLDELEQVCQLLPMPSYGAPAEPTPIDQGTLVQRALLEQLAALRYQNRQVPVCIAATGLR